MNYFCLPKIYQKYTPVLVYGAILYWLMISVWLGKNKSSTFTTVLQFTESDGSVNKSHSWLSFFSSTQVWNSTLVETQTRTHTRTCVHTTSVWCSAISQCWDWVNRFIFPPLVHMGNLSVFTKVVCVCGSVNSSSAEALIYPLYICICAQCD